MKVRELIEMLNKIENKEKDLYIDLESQYGSDYDIYTDDIKIVEGKYDVLLTDNK